MALLVQAEPGSADDSAAVFGTPIRIQGYGDAYPGIRWANGDKALLKSCLRLRVPRSNKSYVGDWWPAGNPTYAEFCVLLVRVRQGYATGKWLVPSWIMDQRGLLPGEVRDMDVAMSSHYSDDIPLKWIVGTVALALPAGIDIKFGGCGC